jgi:anti-sigma regulatory factor (Ser/Thr protein kinase)
MSRRVSNGRPRTRRASCIQGDPVRSSDLRLSLPARPENVAVVRHVLGAFGDAFDLPRALVEDMRLAVTEACTNVVRHAYDRDAPGRLDVAIRPRGDMLDVIVSDHGRGMAASADTAGAGLGLCLIASLTHDLEIEYAPQAGSRLAMSFLRRQPVGAA